MSLLWELSKLSNVEEEYPISEVIKIIKAQTVYKTEKWWQAVILGEAFNRKFIAVYLWQKRNGNWKRIHKLKLNRQDNWALIKNIIDGMVSEL